MKDYSNNKPEFHATIQIVDTSTPDNGDNISLADRQNHDNTVVLKKMVDELSTKSETLERKAETLENKSGGLKFLVSDNGALTIRYPDGNAGGREKELKFENKEAIDTVKTKTEEIERALKDEETVTLRANSWTSSSPFSQVVSISRVRQTASLIMGKAYTKDNTLAEIQDWDEMASLITSAEAQNGSVVFYCKAEKPTMDFRIKLKGAFS